jgi:tetratricopeptide (TPR) repeat protein
MSSVLGSAGFFVVGGPVNRNAPSYVARRADEDLYQGLQRGNFCYVLTSRQMGKSSLKGSVAARLRQEGAQVAQLDLTGLGQNLSVEQWYLGLLFQLGRELDLEDPLEEFWEQHEGLGPMQRWMRAIREVVLERLSGRCVIFIDEIDATRSLPFSTDEFFAGIREIYHRREADAELNRLTFCLLGVATPSDLIQDVRTTPFNIGQRVELNDFSEAEASIFMEGLGRPHRLSRKLLSRVLYWTGGQPYLTQRLCQAVADTPTVIGPAGVDRLCQDLFLSQSARERDDNLLFVRNRILRSDEDTQVRTKGGVPAVLGLYSKVRKATGSRLPLERLYERVKDDAAQPLLNVLRLSGITRVREGFLYVRNRIYYRVFDRAWIESSLPMDEARRQRAARREGQIRVWRIAGPVIALFVFLTALAWRERRQVNSQKVENVTQKRELDDEKAKNAVQMARNIDQAREIEARRLEVARSDADATEAQLKAATAAESAREQQQKAEKESKRADKALDDALDFSTTVAAQIWQRYEDSPPAAAARSGTPDNGNESDAQSGGDSHAKPRQNPMLQAYSDILESGLKLAEDTLKSESSDESKQKAVYVKAVDLFLDCDSLRLQNDLAKARDACNRSADWAHTLSEDKGILLRVISAYAYSGTATTWSWMGDSGEALKTAQTGMQIADALIPIVKRENDIVWNWHKLAQAYGYFGSVDEREKEIPKALQAYSQQLEMDNELYRVARTKGDVDSALSALGDGVKGYDKIAALQMSKKDFQGVEDAYRNAVRIGEIRVQVAKTPKLTRDPSEIRQAQLDLAADHLALARARQELGRLAEARESYTQRIKILSEFPDETAEDRDMEALAYKRLGDFELVYGNKQAALDAYQKRLPLAQQHAEAQSDFSAQYTLSETYQEMGDAQSALGNAAQARESYALALAAANSCLEKTASGETSAGTGPRKTDPDTAWRQRSLALEQKAEVESAMGSRDQARADLQESLPAARQRLALARSEFDKDKDNAAKKDAVVSDYGSLAWLELLNGDPASSIEDATSALNMDSTQTWIKGNLAHGYLLSGRMEEAKSTYLASKGEEVNSEIFEQVVFEDFVVLTHLGLGSPSMIEIEKVLGLGGEDTAATGVARAAQK